MLHKRIVFWQGQPSPHQSSYMRALAQVLPEKEIVAVFEHGLNNERVAMGWEVPALAGVRTLMSPDKNVVTQLALENPADCIHIFSGVRLPLIRTAFELASTTDALLGVLAEARDGRGAYGKLRMLHAWVTERKHRKRCCFVLAIGLLGVQWYAWCGYPLANIFPWAYFVEYEKSDRDDSGARPHRQVIISYVGQCIRRKGVDILLNALALLDRGGWHLQIVGDGPDRRSLEKLAARLAIADDVSFLGVKSNSVVREILNDTDLVVLPSRFDGWGAVVNEAIMAGVPVICSDRCGAADLIRTPDCGVTFRAEAADELAKALSTWINSGSLLPSRRSEIRERAKQIDGRAGAQYFCEVIDFIEQGGRRPHAPWLPAPA